MAELQVLKKTVPGSRPFGTHWITVTRYTQRLLKSCILGKYSSNLTVQTCPSKSKISKSLKEKPGRAYIAKLILLAECHWSEDERQVLLVKVLTGGCSLRGACEGQQQARSSGARGLWAVLVGCPPPFWRLKSLPNLVNPRWAGLRPVETQALSLPGNGTSKDFIPAHGSGLEVDGL